MPKYYQPDYAMTENFCSGMTKIGENQLTAALQILEAEASDSLCYGLALGNSGLVLLRWERFNLAEQRLLQALEHLQQHGCPHPPSWVQFTRNLAESLAGQARFNEARVRYNQAVQLADHLISQHSQIAEAIDLEKAYTFNSWGSTLLQLGSLPNVAIDCFQAARDIYRKYNSDKIGHAETLTNYALTLKEMNRYSEAALALQEALPIAIEGKNNNQVRKIQIATIQLDPNLLAGQDPYQILGEAADEAFQSSQYSTGYVRLCIMASVALQHGKYDVAIEAIEKAKNFEEYLDPSDPNPAKIRLRLAQALEQRGDHIKNILFPLLEGARLWFDRLSKPQISDDFRATTQAMHDHFRFLSRKLLDAERIEEALVAFESGRSLGYAIEMKHMCSQCMLSKNPFIGNPNQVDCTIMEEQQAGLENDGAMIILAFLPPEIVAFIVKKNSVVWTSVQLPNTEDDCKLLIDNIRMISDNLGNAKRLSAIPTLIQELASKIVTNVGSSNISVIIPNNILHNVPWRVLLKHSGIPWNQLATTTNFGMLARVLDNPVNIDSCRAFGNGVAGTVDLNQEAQDFAVAFGSRGAFIRNCESSDVIMALSNQGGILLSCHGDVCEDYNTKEKKVLLNFHNGSIAISDILPVNILSDLVVLSACNSGVYEVAWSDYPIGLAPELIQRGCRYCVGSRYPVNAIFAAELMKEFASKLAAGQVVAVAFAGALENMEAKGFDFWTHISCFELLGRG